MLEDLASYKEFNAEQDKEESVLLNVKLVQIIPVSLLMELVASNAQRTKLPRRMEHAHFAHQDGPPLTKELAFNLKLSVDQDKEESVPLNVKPVDLILDFQVTNFNALDAHLTKLFHHSVSAHHAQLDKLSIRIEMAATH